MGAGWGWGRRLPSLASSWEVLCVQAGDEPKPQGHGGWLVGVGSGWSRLSRVSEISPGHTLEQKEPDRQVPPNPDQSIGCWSNWV